MSDFRLERVDDRLVLRDLTDPKLLPLSVDFLSSQMKHRVRQGLSRSEPLSRALGLRGSDKPFVFDATAGLGVDAFVLAAHGCRVRAVERSEVVYSLLEDGLRRLRESGSPPADRLSFEHGNAIHLLRDITEIDRPDIVYLDPMYPDEGRSKSALPKKGMQMFRRLVGSDLDIEELIAAAQTAARSRVVVKRPLYAEKVQGLRASYVGKTARYDVLAPIS